MIALTIPDTAGEGRRIKPLPRNPFIGFVEVAGRTLSVWRSENAMLEKSVVRIDRIMISGAIPACDLPIVIAEAVSALWTGAIRHYGRALSEAWTEWSYVTDNIDDELTEDEAGAVFASFDRLRRLGVQFDPTFIEKFEAMHPVPSTFDPNNPQRGIQNGENYAQTSEAFVEDDEYEYAGPGRVREAFTSYSDGDADPDGDQGGGD